MVGMKSRMDRPMGDYSLGMRQRSKIAQAIAHRPELIILDEPYNGLDPVGRQEMSSLLRKWVSEGRSLLFASHVLHEIESISSLFLLIFGGRLLASGTSEELEGFVAKAPQEVVVVGSGVVSLVPKLADREWVDSIQLVENQSKLRVGLRDPIAFYEALTQWIADESLQIEQLLTADGNLTTIFESLLRFHRGDNA